MGIDYEFNDFIQSHLTRGAWIEIVIICKFFFTSSSHLTRGAWIEIKLRPRHCLSRRVSHLTRGAWIEISFYKTFYH